MNKSKKINLLYPAMHKFYSALKSLDKFNKDNDFFDNISNLDNFFLEYRNITFVLQKSLANTEFTSVYDLNRDKYLHNNTCKWFLKKRNEVSKENPFNLEKSISIIIYSATNSVALPEKTFTLENDVKYSTLIKSLKGLFQGIELNEVFFSVEFLFKEVGSDKELYIDFIAGISYMKQFLDAMKSSINEECDLCFQLQNKIDETLFYKIPKDFLFIDDYVYYPKNDEFARASRSSINHPRKFNQNGILEIESIRTPLSFIDNLLRNNINKNTDRFLDFVKIYLNLFSFRGDFMPVYILIYEDDTFELITFNSTLKTTSYRITNEIAQRIEQDKIKSIFYICEMIYFSSINMAYKNNLDSEPNETINNSKFKCFFKVDKYLERNAYCFKDKKISNPEYIASVLFDNPNKDKSIELLNPIIEEFNRINKIK